MPTLDDLNNRISILEDKYGALEGRVTNNQTQIHNLDTRLDSTEQQIQDHETRIQELRLNVNDHEKRLKLIENSTIKYTVSREVKYPKKATNGFYLYMPNDLTVDIFREYNSGVVKQRWNWLNKIFNHQGFGEVSFDLDKGTDGRIKTIVLGQNTRIVIPTGISLVELLPVKSVLKAANETGNSINKGLVYGIEILDKDDEIIVSVCNPTSNVVEIAAGSILVQVLHLFSYQTIPYRELT